MTSLANIEQWDSSLCLEEPLLTLLWGNKRSNTDSSTVTLKCTCVPTERSNTVIQGFIETWLQKHSPNSNNSDFRQNWHCTCYCERESVLAQEIALPFILWHSSILPCTASDNVWHNQLSCCYTFVGFTGDFNHIPLTVFHNEWCIEGRTQMQTSKRQLRFISKIKAWTKSAAEPVIINT